MDAVAGMLITVALGAQLGIVVGAFRCWEVSGKSNFDPARAFQHITWLSAVGLACTVAAMLMMRGH